MTRCVKAPNRAEYTGARTKVWLDGVPVILAGLEEWPKIGDRFEVDGEVWRVVEIHHRILCEREPS